VTAGLVLAVDGGNSKTDLALLDASGGLLALVRGPSSSPHQLGNDASVEVLDALLQQAGAVAGVELERPFAASAHILLAGVDFPEERAAMKSSIEALGWSDQLVVDIDMPALLRTGTDRGWGIAVVSGAGVNGFGRAPDGREARFLSLGPTSGDWGGGPEVGMAALAAAVRSADGRGPRTVLESEVAAHFGMNDVLEVPHAIHRGELPAARIEELAALVLRCSEQDAVAAGIVDRLADEVVGFARAAATRLDLLGADPDVVLGGRGLRSLSPRTVETIANGVRAAVPDARVALAVSDPIVGAALLGLDFLRADAGAHERARGELNAAASALITSA
jgi:N-acetylglucosamine kinase-like BadF-type ATPase